MQTIRELANEILNQIGLLQDIEPNNIWLKIESQYSYDMLIHFLEKQTENYQPINLRTLQDFCNFLALRWQRIKNTDACYLHTPDSFGNLAYAILAKNLSPLVGENPYHLLMPTMAANFYLTSRKDITEFEFKEFVLSDENIPIEVAKCLDQAWEKRNPQLLQTGFIKRPLTEAEQQRIIRHSKEAYCYYQAIEYLCNKPEEEKEIENVQQHFYAAMHSKQYQVQASYGQKGLEKLIENLLTECSSLKAIVLLMLKYVPPLDWKKFLTGMDLSLLSKMVLKDKLLSDVIKDMSNYTNDEQHNKAVFCTLTVIYWYAREQKPKYTRTLGWIADYSIHLKKVFHSSSKEEKNFLVDFLLDFFMSDKPLVELERVRTELPALFWGELGVIPTQAIWVGTSYTQHNLVKV